MSRQLSPKSSPEALRREAKRWLKDLRAGDAAARERLQAAWPDAPAEATLRDVQHALAREHAMRDWAGLTAAAADMVLSRRTHDDRVQTLLQHGWNGDVLTARRIAARYPEVCTHDIFTAAACGELETVRALLAHDASRSTATRGPQAWTALAYVAYSRIDDANALAIARLLLDAGADPRFSFDDGWGNAFTLVTGAVGQGEGAKRTHPQARELVELFIAHGADPYDIQTLYNTSIVHDDVTWTALLWSHCERVGRTTEWGDMRGRSLGGSMGLCTLDYLLGNAVAQNHLQRAEWLLERGADARAPHAYSREPLHTMAQLAGYERMAALLRAHGAEPQALSGERGLIAALMREDDADVRTRIEADPSLAKGSAPLMAAAAHDRVRGLALLLAAGASVSLRDHEGATALHRAAHAGALAAIDVLLAAGADVDARDARYQGTPLGWACVLGRPQVADRLAPVSRDVRALARTARLERLEAVLREDPALANHQLRGVDDPTPLFCLPSDDDDAAEVAALLLSYGADRAVTDAKGRTAEQAARARGLDEAADVIARR